MKNRIRKEEEHQARATRSPVLTSARWRLVVPLVVLILAIVKRNLKLIQLRTQTQYKFDTPAHTVFS